MLASTRLIMDRRIRSKTHARVEDSFERHSQRDRNVPLQCQQDALHVRRRRLQLQLWRVQIRPNSDQF
jgi:hypothetical protein